MEDLGGGPFRTGRLQSNLRMMRICFRATALQFQTGIPVSPVATCDDEERSTRIRGGKPKRNMLQRVLLLSNPEVAIASQHRLS